MSVWYQNFFGIMLNNTSLSKFIKTTDTSTENNILNKLKDISLNSF